MPKTPDYADQEESKVKVSQATLKRRAAQLMKDTYQAPEKAKSKERKPIF
jgi:hypothetical protein